MNKVAGTCDYCSSYQSPTHGADALQLLRLVQNNLQSCKREAQFGGRQVSGVGYCEDDSAPYVYFEDGESLAFFANRTAG